MSYDLIVVYRKEGPELQSLSQCDLLRSFRHIREDLEKMSAGMAMIELISIVAREEEENTPLFSLLTDSLAAVEDATKNPLIVLYWFEVQLARILGFQATFDRCTSCRKPLLEDRSETGAVRFHLEKGGPLCTACSPRPGQALLADRGVLRVLHRLSQIVDAQEVARVELEPGSGETIRDFVRKYLRFHVQGLRPLKSERVFSRILG
jgi:DNA repair protein RecO (recombination protein O)